MNRLLIIATLLGGISSLWFLCDQALSMLRRKPETSTRKWRLGNAVARSVVYYAAILGGIAMASLAVLLALVSSPWPGVIFIGIGALCGMAFLGKQEGESRIFSLLKGLGGLVAIGLISALIILFLSPGGPAAIHMLSIGLLPDAPTGFNPNLILVALTSGLCGVIAGATGGAEVLWGASVIQGMSTSLVFYLFMMLSVFVVLLPKGQVWQIAALAALASIVAMGIYMTIDLLPE